MMLTPSIKALSRDLDMMRIEEEDPPGGAEMSMVLPEFDRLQFVEDSTTSAEDIFARVQKKVSNYPPPRADYTLARYRLFRELKRLLRDPPAGISAVPPDYHSCNIMLWNVVIAPHSLDSPWEGGAFKLTLQFSEDYPQTPPIVQFVSRMFHPNVSADGGMSLESLQNRWPPVNGVGDLLKHIQSIICHPNPNCPANPEAFCLYFSENRLEYNRRVRIIVDQCWTED